MSLEEATEEKYRRACIGLRAHFQRLADDVLPIYSAAVASSGGAVSEQAPARAVSVWGSPEWEAELGQAGREVGAEYAAESALRGQAGNAIIRREKAQRLLQALEKWVEGFPSAADETRKARRRWLGQLALRSLADWHADPSHAGHYIPIPNAQIWDPLPAGPARDWKLPSGVLVAPYTLDGRRTFRDYERAERSRARAQIAKLPNASARKDARGELGVFLKRQHRIAQDQETNERGGDEKGAEVTARALVLGRLCGMGPRGILDILRREGQDGARGLFALGEDPSNLKRAMEAFEPRLQERPGTPQQGTRSE